METRRRVVVIGAGVAGLATARELARAGCDPLVLGTESGQSPRPTAFASSSILLAQHTTDDVRDASEAKVMWRRLERDIATRLLFRCGSVEMGDGVAAARAALDECGVEYDTVTATHPLHAVLSPHVTASQPLFQADGAVVDASRVRLVMAADAAQHGATIEPSAVVRSVEMLDERVRIHLDDTVVTTEMLVVAAGPQTPALAVQLGQHVPGSVETHASVRMSIGLPKGFIVPAVVERTAEGHEFRLLRAVDGSLIVTTAHAGGQATSVGEPARGAETWRKAAAWARSRFKNVGAVLEGSDWNAVHVQDERFHLVRTGPLVTVACRAGRGHTYAPLIGARAAALAHEGLSN